MRIDRDRLIEQSQSLENPLFRNWKEGRKRAQIEIVGGEIGRRPRGGAAHLGCLQGRLDDPGDAESDFVLKLENVFDQAVEAVGPQVRAGLGVDQLAGDAHPVAALAHRAFEHIAHPKLAPDLLHIDGPALVGKGGVAGDDEQPTDRERAVMISSTMPSTKYSCSGSPLILGNGNTAIDGLSGSGARARPVWRRQQERSTRKTRTGRAMFLTCCSPKSSKTIKG